MRKLRLLSAFLIIASILTSCSDEPVDPTLANQLATNNSNSNNNNGGGTTTTTGAFTASVDGTGFVANSTIGSYTTTSFGNQLSLTGVTTDGKTISIQILNPSVATFQANFDVSHLLLFQYQDISLGANGMFNSYNSTTSTSTGTMTITNFDLTNKKISATFSFTAYNTSTSTVTKSVTTGVINNVSFTDSTTTTPPVTTSFVGTYLMTAFNTSVPTDLNGDGTPSTNQMNETSCFNNSLLTLNANNTYTANSKGIDINTTGSTSVIACTTDPDDNGTWVLNGSVITLTSTTTPGDVFSFNVNGSTLSATEPNGQAVGVDQVSGAPVYLNCDITIVYTKQ